MTEPTSRRDRARAEQQAKMEQFRAAQQDELGLADPPRDGESFDQFHARHIVAQTRAARDSARHLATIKLVLQVFFWLMVLGAVVVLIQLSQVSSRY